ncbi:phosphatidylinositol 3 kinase, putative [Trypanosoma brucei gambiense DAL972]|uniref:Serine/threonine-protein kinase TOR n=1 Tax=Trypanosoma brucei gambiense (strain MHOM/CI/86/DAL972) TaxID=679716 RepID=D0A3T9_TRYB9|nr:phosphatidylinositol 3 kinase, putative [Trypanosoma brucei gambiense DAL972]CBH15933.1 phosphatidylinositol 3 kinase, putative [Trypanosoma brucei gambiense DAL972]|eukprot:XP_011778197.1 phosphatidylinositol 3 kinase, putative [Trypanosoma brucei gambiense DAL972]
MEGCAHPLTSQLQPIFSELHSGKLATLSSTISKLENVLKDQGDGFFQSNSECQSREANLRLSVWISSQIGQLFRRPETQRAAILCVKTLLDVEYEAINNLDQTFLRLLEDSVKCADMSVSRMAAEVWGLWLNNSGTSTEGIAQSRLKICFADLRESDKVMDKVAACLFLEELLKRTPSTVAPLLDVVAECLHPAVLSSSDLVQASAATALRYVLLLMYTSMNPSGIKKWYETFLSASLDALRSGAPERRTGAIRCFNAVMSSVTSNVSACDTAVTFSETSVAHVHEIWEYVSEQVTLTSTLELRRELLQSLTILALYDTEAFKRMSIAKVVEAASGVFQTPAEKDLEPLVFQTLGKLAGVMPDQIVTFLGCSMHHIEEVLKQGRHDACGLGAIACVAAFAEVNPRAVRPYLRQILAPILSGSLTVDFAKGVARICAAFPELRSTCLSKILEVAKKQLRDDRCNAGGAGALCDGGVSPEAQILSALSNLEFAGYPTLPFLCDTAVAYVSVPNGEVRRAAIKLCFKLVLSGCLGPQSPCRQTSDGVVIHSGCEHTQLFNKVIKKLVNAAVADPESDIRLDTLRNFTEEFDHTLALRDVVRSLFPALHDKHQNRLAVVRLLGRVSRRNPAHVYPMLRRIMVQCVTEMQYFEHAKKQEQAFSVLGAIIESAPGLCKPYISSLLNMCAARLSDGTREADVCAALLSCVGKLVRYAEGDDIRVCARIRPIVVQHILDSSHLPKKREALRALGDIVRTTKDVNVYEDHAELLPVLLQALHGGFKELWPVRKDVLQLMGIIGAVDPVRVKEILRGPRVNNNTKLVPFLPFEGEDTIAQTVVRSVLHILSLPSLTEDQSVAAVQVIVGIFSLEVLSPGCLVSFYGEVISSIQKQARVQVRKREEILVHLISLVRILKGHLRPHLKEITSTVDSFISAIDLSVLRQVLALLKELCCSLREEFRPYMSSLLGPIIVLVEENVEETSEIVLDFFSAMGSLLEDHLHTVLPVVCNIIVDTSVPSRCRIVAVKTLICFTKRLPDLCFHASRCVHCLCRVLRESDGGDGVGDEGRLGCSAMEALCTLAGSLGKNFENFVLVVLPAVADRYGETSGEYCRFCHDIYEAIDGKRAPEVSSNGVGKAGGGGAPSLPFTAGTSASPLKDRADAYASLRFHLRKRDQASDEDWNHWLPQLAVNLLRSSSSPSHGRALTLAELHEPFARQMLHSAFAACYADMDEHTQREVIGLLTEVLRGLRVPSEVMQELLNLSEHMERQGIRLSAGGKASIKHSSNFCPFDRQVLMESSANCNLYSKALHYAEIEFFETVREYERSILRGCPKPLPVEDWQNLIKLCEKSIYFCNLLGQRESANGILKFIRQNLPLLTGKKVTELSQMMDAHLFDKLRWWSQSLQAYERRLQQEPNKVSNMVGLLRALDALGEYPRVLEMWRQFSKRVSKREVSKLASMGAHAAWLLRRWDDMEHITSFMSDEDYTGTTALFYKATLAARKKRFREAEKLIDMCRKRVDSKLSALVAESYDRAYDLFVGIQQLSELEELAMATSDPQSAMHWRQLWERRLSVMAYEGWPGTLANHTLLVPPSSEIDMWLRFVSLSRAHGQGSVSTEVLRELLGNQSIESAIENGIPTPAVAMGSFQHLYETNQRDSAIARLQLYVSKVEGSGAQHVSREREDMAVCHAKLAEWLVHQKKAHRTEDELQKIFHHLRRATELDKSNGSIWRTLARVHREAATKPADGSDSSGASGHIMEALSAYLRSVSLSEELEDALGFLSLWFMYGPLLAVQVGSTLKEEIEEVNPTVWLKVIPQIIARISSPNGTVADSVYNLLVLVARRHPQAILYSLNVAHSSYQGKGTADGVEPLKGSHRVLARIAEIHQNGKAMVEDSALVCRELVRCAVLWPELWINELGRALYQWERQRSAENLLLAMGPLLEQLKRPETMAEAQFAAELRQPLENACCHVERAVSSRHEQFMEEARRIFVSIERRIREQISGMSSLALQLVSPKLHQNGRNLSLVVPGQYREDGNYPLIASFQNVLKVLNSKQRPRRIYINGSNGEIYKFLLKGHEDLRLDERVMQLLGFVNTILEKHSVAKRHDCLIQTYSVTPLSDNAGLVGWVDHCDTLNKIIEDYRVNPRCIRMELDLMRSMCDNLYYLTAIQRVEPFEFALERTEGVDLVRSFWVKAPSAETWLERRTTYVCSLATMSMVGHILGLGDRHPSNLMIHAFSGRVVHIDFGDCFEVAQQRSIHPEKVPFRLTRMLVKAMEMGGIEGLFRHGCHTVMNVLREEGGSLLALLEAFVHDPLVSWWRDEAEGFSGNGQTASSVQTISVIGSMTNVAEEGSVGSLQLSQLSVQRRATTQQRVNANIEKDTSQTRKPKSVVKRIKRKLRGLEFPQSQEGKSSDGFTVEEQVSRLIEEATSNENLCVHFLGWCPFW